MYHTYAGNLVRKFHETGSGANKKIVTQNLVRNETVEVAVLTHIVMEPTMSIRIQFKE